MKTDEEIVEMMQQMKEEGRPEDEVGYAVTAAIYGVPETTETDIRIFLMTMDQMLEDNPEDQFVLGSKRWVAENYKLSTLQ